MFDRIRLRFYRIYLSVRFALYMLNPVPARAYCVCPTRTGFPPR
jgi:hypothetical protein